MSAGRGGKTDAGDPGEHLANERTLLAWMRTGVVLISIGIVVERVGSLVAPISETERFS